MDAEQLEAYLARIVYRGDRLPSPRTLAALHTSHMLTVPFENLDIVVTGRHIEVSLDAIYEKIVERRRGGFCSSLELLSDLAGPQTSAKFSA